MNALHDQLFQRSRLLLGDAVQHDMEHTRVALFGTGGVGSWCAEALVRSGVGHITLVDSDVVAASNVNRQLPATTLTIGQAKVEVLRERLLSINPDAMVEARAERYTPETSDAFHLADYDYVIDAIDSLPDKAHLILTVTRLMKRQGRPVLLSSMGAALRVDPTKVRVSEFRKVQGDGLASALRRRFRKDETYPACKFRCVHSEEQPRRNQGAPSPEEPRANGSLCPVTAIFGMTLAGLVVHDVSQRGA